MSIERIRSLADNAGASLDLVGESDWTPQDQYAAEMAMLLPLMYEVVEVALVVADRRFDESLEALYTYCRDHLPEGE